MAGLGSSLDKSLAQAVKDDDVAKVTELLDAEADPNAFCCSCCGGLPPVRTAESTPVHVAALLGRTEIMRAFIAKGANIRDADRDLVAPETPLAFASRAGHRAMVSLLVAEGAPTGEQPTGRHPVLTAIWGPVRPAEAASDQTIAAMLDAGAFRLFSETAYAAAYSALTPASGRFSISVEELQTTMEAVVDDFVAETPQANIGQPDRDDFLVRVKAACVRPLEESDQLVERVWTCAEDCAGFEFCHMVNNLISKDQQVGNAVKYSRALNRFCVTGPDRGPSLKPVKWPPANETYRAGGLPREHRAFFRRGVRYRAARVLPTSFRYREEFAQRQPNEYVKWTFRLPDSRKCHQVNYVTNEALGITPEEEFLFAAYSVFEVVTVTWSKRPFQTPHEIVVKVPVDNRDEPEDLPCAPWC